MNERRSSARREVLERRRPPNQEETYLSELLCVREGTEREAKSSRGVSSQRSPSPLRLSSFSLYCAPNVD